jgi:hypothetical protein
MTILKLIIAPFLKAFDMKSAIFFGVLLLSSCNAANNYYENMKHTSSLRYFVSDEEKLARYQKTCRSIGVTEESDNWDACLITAKQTDESTAAARAASQRAKVQACTMNPANC